MRKGSRITWLLSAAALWWLPSSLYPQAKASGPVIKGDIRFRHETIDQERSPRRNMERLRVRLNLTAKPSDTVSLVFGVASGQTNDPITENQNLTGGFSDKPLWIDLMYFDWTAGKDWLHVTGGKMKNPFYAAGRNQLIWDQDMNPEGFGAQVSKKKGGAEFFANGSLFWLEERPAANDTYMAGAQGGLKTSAAGNDITIGAGFLDFVNMKGRTTLYDSTKSAGNSVDAKKHYLYNYRIAEKVNNLAEDAKDTTGWLVGLNLGKLKNPGSWMIRYHYETLEKNAVVGAFTNSDFAGSGTDIKGHSFGVDIQITPQSAFAITYMLNKRGLKNGLDYHRFQTDVSFRF